MSPQPLSTDEFKPRYAQKRVLGPKFPNMAVLLTRSVLTDFGLFNRPLAHFALILVCWVVSTLQYTIKLTIHTIIYIVHMWYCTTYVPYRRLANKKSYHQNQRGHLGDRPKIWGKDPYRSIHNKVESIQYPVFLFYACRHVCNAKALPFVSTPRIYAPLNLPLRV